MIGGKRSIAALFMIITFSNAWTQEQMDHDMSEMDHSGMEMDGEGTSDDTTTLRDPHAYAGGYSFSQFGMRHEEVDLQLGSLRVDRLERVSDDDNSSAAYDIQGWYGSGYDRAVIKAEGSADGGRVDEGRAELLWSRAIAPFWDAQLGLRRDHGAGPGRNWLAIGVQGLAPYWFELGATAYLGDQGRSALRLDAEYELLLTQRLILQPALEAEILGKRDAERQEGSGLSEAVAGLRLRYEIRREFAPYIGIEWAGKFGSTADYARMAGERRAQTRTVAGLRFWF